MLLRFSCCQDLRLFLVWDAEGEEDREDTAVEELFRSVDGSDSETEEDAPKKKGEKKKTQKKTKKKSSSSASTESNSVESISSSTDPCL